MSRWQNYCGELWWGLWPLLLAHLLPNPLWGLEGELGGKVERTLVQVVAGPPGTLPQELGTDHARAEAVASHRQALGAGWSAEATVLAALDTLPSGDTRNLPPRKLEPSARVLEGWLGWEALPGLLTLGAGKRILQPSSAFSHKPLDWLSRSDDPDSREGRTGAQAALFGDAWSASVFAAPALAFDGTAQAFGLGRLGVHLGSVDVKALVLQYTDDSRPRGGLGLDGGWGDHLTLRAEAAADADPAKPRVDTLAGLTWTTDDQTTLMFEGSWDDRGQSGVTTGFARLAGNLEDRLTAEAWLKAESKAGSALSNLGGWVGSGLTWSAPTWSMEGTWLAAWGPPGTTAGDSALRWKVGLEVKTFW